MQSRGRRRQPGIAMFMLLSELYRYGFHNIPPVTLSFLAAQVAIFLGFADEFISTSLRKTCISVDHVWYSQDWKRLIIGALIHADEWHLYYNMASFLWKGSNLERKFGSMYFLFLLMVFTPLCGIIMIALNMMLEDYNLFGGSHYHSCAVGFSAVLFALKVLTSHYSSEMYSPIGHFLVPMKYACWVELILIQLITPNASFTGHLAGILVGLLYLYTPLKPVMKGVFRMFLNPTDHFYHPPPRFTNTHPQSTGYRSSTDTAYGQRSQSFYTERPQQTAPNTFQPSNISEDELFQQAVRNSLQDTHPSRSSQPSAPPQDEEPSPYGWRFRPQ